MGNQNDMENDEEMTVVLELDDGTKVSCSIITILEVEGKDYIVLLPATEDEDAEEGEVWFYQLVEDAENPDAEPELVFIEDDEEYEKVAEAFDSFLDDAEYDELIEDEADEEE